MEGSPSRTVAAARDSFAAQNDRDPTVSELCTLCSLSDDEVLAALDAGTPLLSFDAEYGDTTLENLVGCLTPQPLSPIPWAPFGP